MAAIILDTETTGRLEPVLPIEIAYLSLSDPINLQITYHFEQRYNPAKPIETGAMATHHILDEELADCPPPSDFFLPYDTEYIIGHNIDYDWKVIGKPTVKRICTLALARKVWPSTDSYSLSALIYFLATDRQKARDTLRSAHSALADVKFTHYLLRKILATRPCQTWEELWNWSESARIPETMPFGKHKDVPIKNLPRDYIDWALRNLTDMDEYLRKALLAV